jgi:hypothetical protein
MAMLPSSPAIQTPGFPSLLKLTVFSALGFVILIPASSLFTRQKQERVSLAKPLLEVEPSGGFTLNLVLLPYRKETIFFLLPEGVTASPEDPDVPGPEGFHWTRKSKQDYSLGEDGWWILSEENPGLRYTSRARVNKTGERLDMELSAVNMTKYPWRFVNFSPCVGPPNSFRDPGLRRTYVLGNNGKLQAVGSMVDHYNYNIISVQGGPGPNPKMKPYWRFRDLRLPETLIMTEASDGRYTLVKAFEKASSVITGVTGPCIHSEAMTRPVAPGETTTVRGFLALVAGNAKSGKEYYQEWKRLLHAPESR